MALDDSYAIVRPGQDSQQGSVSALHLEEFTGVVESTIERKSVLKGLIPVRPVRGTSTITNFAVGESTLQKATPGSPIDGTGTDFAKRTLTVDTVVLARAVLPLLETFQTSYNSRKEIGQEHGKKIAKFTDQSFFIQAIKAALLTESAYKSAAAASGKPAGHYGGSQYTLGAAGDALDPAKLYAAIANLFVKLEEKDVDPRTDDVVIALRPAEFYTLLQNEQLIDGTYKTSEGTSITAHLLKAYGVPVVSSTNFPAGSVISSHLLGTAYDGDFTKVAAAAFSPRALLAGETIPLTTDVFWDKLSKQWFVDAHLSYGVTPNRAEFAGVILKP